MLGRGPFDDHETLVLNAPGQSAPDRPRGPDAVVIRAKAGAASRTERGPGPGCPVRRRRSSRPRTRPRWPRPCPVRIARRTALRHPLADGVSAQSPLPRTFSVGLRPNVPTDNRGWAARAPSEEAVGEMQLDTKDYGKREQNAEHRHHQEVLEHGLRSPEQSRLDHVPAGPRRGVVGAPSGFGHGVATPGPGPEGRT